MQFRDLYKKRHFRNLVSTITVLLYIPIFGYNSDFRNY